MLEKIYRGIGRWALEGLTVLVFMGMTMCLPVKAADSLPEEKTETREEKKEDYIDPVKNSIVEIRSGFEKEDGSIDYLRNASGVVISADSESNDVFILTTYKAAHCGKKKKKQYCKEKKLNDKEVNLTSVVKIATTGNVALNAEVYTKSKEFNYCILKCSEGLKNKDPVMLGKSGDLVTGEKVIALGFVEANPAGTQGSDYEKEEVTVRVGEIQDKDAADKNRDYLQHSAKMEVGMTGSPLLNEKGELVGINDAQKTDINANIYYAIPSDEIQKTLDSLKIRYSTNEMVRQRDDFTKTLDKSRTLLEDKNYKEKSKKKLEEAVNKGSQLLESREVTPDQYAQAEKELAEAEKELVRKMKTSRKIVIVLGCIALFLFLWFLKQVFWWARHRKQRGLSGDKNDRRYSDGSKDSYSKDSYEEEIRLRKEASRHRERERTGPDRGRRHGPLSEERARHYSDKGHGSHTPPPRAAGLYYTRTGQFKKIDRMEFRVGKRKDNDYIIDNRQVSRNHMVIRWEKTHYTITDLDSVNGTIVNGKKIRPGTTIVLHNDDRIFLANEEFVFRMLD